MANIKITGLPLGVTLSGTEPFESVQAGISVKIPASYFSLPTYPYVTAVDFSSTLTEARRLTAGSGISLTDNGAGSTLVIATTGSPPGSSVPTTVQGDTLYASAVNTLSALAKDTNATRYVSNTGLSNNPAWAQVDLTNGVTGTLPIANGGTGQTSANAALNALLPSQTSQSGKVLTSDGTNTSWQTAGGGSSAPTLVVSLSPLSSAAFDGVSFSDWDTASVIQTSTDAHWDDVGKDLVFDTTGIYRVTVQATGTPGFLWPDDLGLYGTRFNGSGVVQYTRYQKAAEGANFLDQLVQWVAETYVQATALDTLVIALYAQSYASFADTLSFSMNVLVQRISP